MKKIAAVLCAVCLALGAGGCSGGSIYSNYRDIGQLAVIQTLGFDLDGGGVRLSVSAEGSGGTGSGDGGVRKQPLRLCADARSVLEAQELLKSYAGGRQLFFGHTSYLVLGRDALENDVARFFDCIERNAAFRLRIPVFAVGGGSASELVLGAGDGENDVTQLMHAVEENLRLRGDAKLYTAAEIVSSLDLNGTALICAVKSVPAQSADPDAEDGELAVVPDGYIIINENRAAGHIPMELARGVSIIENDAGTMPVSVGNTTLLIESTSCGITPVFSENGPEALEFDVKLTAALGEAEGNFEPAELERELCGMVRSWIREVLELSLETGCDFLHLGSALEIKHPLRMRGAGTGFADVMPRLRFDVSVSAELSRSFHLDLSEALE